MGSGHAADCLAAEGGLRGHLFALPAAGDARELEGWLDTLEALDGRGGSLFAGWYGDRLMPRVTQAAAGAPDLDACAEAWLSGSPRRAGRGRPSRREPDRILAAMRAAYLADVAQRQRTGRLRRVPRAVPQPGPQALHDWGGGELLPADGDLEPLRCHACALVGVAAPLTRHYQPDPEAGPGRVRVVVSCPSGHESLDGSRRASLADLGVPPEDRDYWQRVDAGDKEAADRRYGLEVRGTVAEVIEDFTGSLPEPRTVKRWIADGRRALASLGLWPWAVARPDGRLDRRWWRGDPYRETLVDVLGIDHEHGPRLHSR